MNAVVYLPRSLYQEEPDDLGVAFGIVVAFLIEGLAACAIYLVWRLV